MPDKVEQVDNVIIMARTILMVGIQYLQSGENKMDNYQRVGWKSNMRD